MPFVCCPFCGEAGDLRILGDWPASRAHFVVCGTCHTRGPLGETREQAIANWNRRPTSTLGPIIVEGGRKWPPPIVAVMDGLTVGAAPPSADDSFLVPYAEVASHFTIPIEMTGLKGPLDTSKFTGVRDGEQPLPPFAAFVADVTDLVCPPPATDAKGQIAVGPDHSVIPLRVYDDLAAARERRDLASLPSFEVGVQSDGTMSMDFDLGGPPPKGKR